MSKKLVIVESPKKAKTIERFLGSKFKVLGSNGHVRGLPEKRFAVDVDNNFEPTYVIEPKQKKKVDELKELFRERFPLDDSINKITEDAEKIIESINKKKEEDSKKSADNKNSDEEATAEDTNKLID